ncbi:MAG: hypothetical protein HOO87_17960 [Methyloglobulus sp.]|jgi:hypothetical protein|nr:hypothetical protein [Methyloglobulus sp.]NOU45397.1 hypothetical protein [Methyloglobulus sp.]
MTKLSDLHKKWRRDPDYRAAYDALEIEFAKTTLSKAQLDEKATTQTRKTVN